jgi:peptide chain release factor subunit 1
MSKEVFRKRILDKIEDPALRRRLEMFYNSNLLAVKIFKIESIGKSKTVDIETKSHNFLANGLVVHNSAQRFHRITEGLAKEFFRRVAEAMKEHFFEREKLKGILVGGPIPTKEEFLDQGQLVTKLKDKVIAVRDIGDTELPGLRMLVESCQDILLEQEITKQKQILDEFFSMLGKQPEKVAYGMAEVEQRLTDGSAGKLIISKTLTREKIKELEKLAESTGVDVFIVTSETSEGVQFDNMGGVGALLRFAVS